MQQLAEALPIGLNEMYNDMLTKAAAAPDITQDTQLFILRLTTLTARPLRLNEVAAALIFTKLPNAGLAEGKRVIRAACAPLLEIQEDETIHVIHHSFTEFLFDQTREAAHKRQFPAIRPGADHATLHKLCLGYMLRVLGAHDDTDDPEELEDEIDVVERGTGYGLPVIPEHPGFDYQTKRLQLPLLEYAVKHWTNHSLSADTALDHDGLDQFASPNNRAFNIWIDLELHLRSKRRGSSIATVRILPLHMAAFAGLQIYASRLISDGADVNAVDSDDRAPLHWAPLNGHHDIVRQLLECGAEPNIDDYKGRVALHEAAKRNRAEAVKLLLEAGVDLLTPKTLEDYKGYTPDGGTITKGETSIEYAAEAGHVATLRAMIPSMTQELADQALCLAAKKGRHDAVELLLGSGKCSAEPMYEGQTALYLCSSRGLDEAVKFLLKGGADPNRISQWVAVRRRWCGGSHKGEPATAIEALTRSHFEGRHRRKRILQDLVAAGGDLEVKRIRCDTPLKELITSHMANVDTLCILLECGADVSSRFDNGDHIFHACLKYQHDVALVRALVRHGVAPDVIGPDAEGNYPVHCAVGFFSGNNGRYNVFSTSNLVPVVKYLQGCGARFDLRNKKGLTPLELAAANSNCDFDTLRYVALATKAQDPQDILNALSKCLHNISLQDKGGPKEIIQWLLAQGANIEYRNSDGASPFLARADGSWDIAEIFLACGADPNTKDKLGRNALHRYVRSYGAKLHRVKRLISLGVDPLAASSVGTVLRCALHDGGNQQIIEHLIGLGADPGVQDSTGRTILHERAPTFRNVPRYIGPLEYFIKLGVSPNIQDKRGRTAFHVYLEEGCIYSSDNADESDRKSMLEVFHNCHFPFDVNIQDDAGRAPIHLAAARSEFHTDELIEFGVNLHLRTKSAQNVLHIASQAGESNTLGLLLAQTDRSLLDQLDDHGKTPIQYACEFGIKKLSSTCSMPRLCH